MNSRVILEFRNIVQYYFQANRKLVIFDHANFKLTKGQMVALVAPSGAGKSTLLHIAALLEKPKGGEVFVKGQECSALTDNQRTALRCNEIGFVYQFHYLLSEFTALENVMIPKLIQGASKEEALSQAHKLLDMMRLTSRAHHKPKELSGGEQQRVAIARAVVNSPGILLADEPTGNLDEKTADHVFEVLKVLVHETGLTALIATHNFRLAERMDRQVMLSEGKIKYNTEREEIGFPLPAAANL